MPTTKPPPTKRLRFSDQVTDRESPRQQPPPAAVARQIVEDSVRSHPESVQKFIVNITTRYNKLKMKEQQQQNTATKLADEDFLPRSARFGFKLKGSESVMETEAFQKLASTTAEKIKTLQDNLKTAMQSMIKLEIEATQKEINKLFLQTINKLGSIFYLMSHPNSKTSNVPHHAITQFLLDKQCGSLFKHVTITNNSKFARYTEYAMDAVTFQSGDTPQSQATPFAKVSTELQPILEDIFVKSWDKHVQELNKCMMINNIEVQLREFTVGAKTEATAMELNTKAATDPATVKNLIQNKVATQVKQIKTDLNKLGQRLTRQPSKQPAKNNSWGANPKRAP